MIKRQWKAFGVDGLKKLEERRAVELFFDRDIVVSAVRRWWIVGVGGALARGRWL